MQLRFFTIPCIGGEQMEAELNRFLGSQKVLTVDRQIVDCNGAPCWACCVSYLPSSQPGLSADGGKEREKVGILNVFGRIERKRSLGGKVKMLPLRSIVS